MLQCQDCEFGKELPDGGIDLTCDPARNIKEPECLTKWQILLLQNIRRDSALVAEVMPELKTWLSLVGPLAIHANDQITEREKSDDWKHGGADQYDTQAMVRA